jgi:thioredoxin-dependent peroxiredoxin
VRIISVDSIIFINLTWLCASVPSARTPYCRIEAKAFQEASDAIASLGASIVGISTDTQPYLKKFADQFNLTFPLLSDPGGEVGSLYGCRVHVPLLNLNFDTRTTFLISPESELVLVFHDVDPHTAAKEVLRALEELVTGTRSQAR